MTVKRRPTPARADGRATRWAGQRERRRKEFVDAALAAITEHGPDVSTQQIADKAGVPRTRLYRHFSGKADLASAIAERVIEQVVVELDPVWNPRGTPMEMIELAVRTHVTWMAEHEAIYQYVINVSGAAGVSAYHDVKVAVSGHIAALFREYLQVAGGDTTAAEPAAYGLVGFVDAATNRWLENPTEQTREELIRKLVDWAWLLISDTAAKGGLKLDPDQRLPTTEELRARRTER
ncbi:TetR/AcrR family transcriptional regulator [Haloechinothrix salitolerans]|uniref:TetR/AcrR family transcriptional regulator n=1 Tax=Haloechinothrix salitolerans TaxID=926830 RepID=A0ABW2BTL6_9PSEU